MHRGLRELSIAAVLVVLSACGTEPATTTTLPEPATTTSAAMDATSTTTTSQPFTTSTVAAAVEPADDLLVVGDWGYGSLPQGAVAGAMMRYAEDNDVEAILTTGDNFYSDDTEFLMEPFGWARDSGIPFWVAWGNHDVETDARVEAVEEAFGGAPRWTAHDWGPIDVIILDSTQVESEEQSEFLASVMADSEDPGLVVFHHPVLSCGGYGDSETIASAWLPLFDDDVIAVLNGHEHNYQRFEHEGISYLVSGGGGAPLTEPSGCPDGHPEMLADASTHHFLVMEQTSAAVSVSAIDVNGEVIDEVEIDLP